MACIEPTIPPNETHLIRHYSGGTTVPFGWVADYSCEPGYYFGEDFNMTHFNLTCYKNGSWEAPEHWKQCYQPTGELEHGHTLLGVPSCVRLCQQEFGEFPRPAWAVGSYSSGPPAGGTPQILVDKTSPMTGRLRVYLLDNICSA